MTLLLQRHTEQTRSLWPGVTGTCVAL